MSVAELLSEVQRTLKAPKGQFNSFGKYKYRNCEDILEAVKKVMPEGCYVTCHDDVVEIGGRVYVKATSTFCHESEKISSQAFAREPLNKKGMDESQITGTASSYARKYSLNGLFAIDDTKDSDSMDNREDKEQDPGEYIMPIGKAKGSPLKSIDNGLLQNSVSWMKDTDANKFKEIIAAVELYLGD